MHTIQINIEDSLYEEFTKKGIDIKKEIEKNIHKFIYAKEYAIAQEIKEAIHEIKENKTIPINKLFDEI